jgi:PhzF family phenazine biosynthesis protein
MGLSMDEASPRNRAFKQVDVFTSVPLLGNPVAVILDAQGLSDAQMQQIANWTNLSETTFVLPASDSAADYHVRIFTPRSELPFAGHPTLGTAHAVIEAGIATPTDGKLIQQCTVGLVDVTIDADSLSFRLPRYAFMPAPDIAALIAAIGGAALIKGTPQIVDVGPRWAIAELVSSAAVEQLTPDLMALATYERTHGTTGLTVFATGAAGDISVRSFAPSDGLMEDPVCGSGNGAVAAYRLNGGSIGAGDAYLASQGRQVGRDGRVSVRIEGRDVHVGGACVTCVDGVFRV